MNAKRVLSMLSLVLLLGVFFVACDNVKDSDLETKAMEVMATNPDASNVDVMVVDKVATLSGTVEDDMVKAHIETSVKEVKGIASVVNNIMVIPPAPDYTEMDAGLREALPLVLADYPTVVTEVNDGVIVLTGELKEKDLPKVMEIVMALNPNGVENNITIK